MCCCEKLAGNGLRRCVGTAKVDELEAGAALSSKAACSRGVLTLSSAAAEAAMPSARRRRVARRMIDSDVARGGVVSD